MNLNSSAKKIVLLAIVAIISGCNYEYHSIGEDLLPDRIFETGKEKVPVFSFQQEVKSVQTDGLPLAQLGRINHLTFGLSEANITSQLRIDNNPIFGEYSQAKEDEGSDTDDKVIPENERVTAVFLEIPFFNNQKDTDKDGVIDAQDVDPNDSQSDSDGDGLTDLIEKQIGLNPLAEDSDHDGIPDAKDRDNKTYEPENKVYEIDSIYGNRSAMFNLKVYELTYYLNNLNPNNNFETTQGYYSNQDYFEQGFYGSVLHDAPIVLNFDEVRLNHTEDDPDTEDIDETQKVKTRLSPRIRVPLNTDFFQTKIIDKEGSTELSSLANFREYFRGIIIRTDNFSDDLYMLLDIKKAQIKIDYEYDKYDIVNATVERKKKTFAIDVAGVQFNTLKNSLFDASITAQANASEQGNSAGKLYLKSGRFHGMLRLFDENAEAKQDGVLKTLREKPWLINEANLIFYIDPEQSIPEDQLLALRLYLYEIKTGDPLIDYDIDITSNRKKFGGLLEYDDSNRPYRYKFKITNHVSKIIRKDSTNVDLGLAIISDIDEIKKGGKVKSKKANLATGETIKYPEQAILNPLNVILIGSHPDSSLDTKKIQLEIVYTEY